MGTIWQSAKSGHYFYRTQWYIIMIKNSLSHAKHDISVFQTNGRSFIYQQKS